MAEQWRIVHPGAQQETPTDNSMQWKIKSPGYEGQGEESLLGAVGRAPFRMGEDIYNAVLGGIRAIPSYAEKARTEVPGIFKTAKEHPGHLAMQGLAGSQELINQLAQLPRELTGYAEKRLNLLPKGSEKAVAKFSPEDTSQAISELFGEPKYPGEALARGGVRNLPLLYGLAKAPQALNLVRPGKTANEFAKQGVSDIQKEYAKGIKAQKIAYNKFFEPYGETELTKAPEQFLGLESEHVKALLPTAEKLYKQFLKKPNANHLHEFQSQLGKDAVRVHDEHLKQLFRDIQTMSQDKLEGFAKTLNDANAYSGLLEGRAITRNIVKPFESTPTMRKIAQKNIKPGTRDFDELQNAVQSAIESGRNVLDPMTGEIKSRIKGVPDDHYLRMLQEELSKKENIIGRRKKYRNVLLGASGLTLEEAIRRSLMNNAPPGIGQ